MHAGAALARRVDRHNHDTISMIALDSDGNIAAGSSTNGASHKVGTSCHTAASHVGTTHHTYFALLNLKHKKGEYSLEAS